MLLEGAVLAVVSAGVGLVAGGAAAGVDVVGAGAGVGAATFSTAGGGVGSFLASAGSALGLAAGATGAGAGVVAGWLGVLAASGVVSFLHATPASITQSAATMVGDFRVLNIGNLPSSDNFHFKARQLYAPNYGVPALQAPCIALY